MLCGSREAAWEELLPSLREGEQLPGKSCYLPPREGEQLLGENCFLPREEGEQLPEWEDCLMPDCWPGVNYYLQREGEQLAGRIASFPRRKLSNCQGNRSRLGGLGRTASFRGKVSSCWEKHNLARNIKESIYIRVNNPSLNNNIGKFNLSHIWDRVLLNTKGLTL